MSIMSSQKRALNIADLRALISPNPRATLTQSRPTPEKEIIRSQGESYLNEQLSSGSQDEFFQKNFFFPKMRTEEESLTPTRTEPKTDPLVHFSELQRTRKTMQDHEATLHKITSSLSEFNEVVSNLRSDVKSLRTEVQDINSLQRDSTESVSSQVTSYIQDTNKTISSTLDKIIASQEALHTTVTELRSLFKSNSSIMEDTIKKLLKDQNVETERRMDAFEKSVIEAQEKNTKILRKELETMWDHCKTEMDQYGRDNLDDLLNIDGMGSSHKRRKVEE